MLKVDPKLLHEARSFRIRLIAAVIFGILASIPLILSAYFLSQIVNNVFLAGRMLDEVHIHILLILTLQIIRAGLNWGGSSMILKRRVNI